MGGVQIRICFLVSALRLHFKYTVIDQNMYNMKDSKEMTNCLLLAKYHYDYPCRSVSRYRPFNQYSPIDISYSCWNRGYSHKINPDPNNPKTTKKGNLTPSAKKPWKWRGSAKFSPSSSSNSVLSKPSSLDACSPFPSSDSSSSNTSKNSGPQFSTTPYRKPMRPEPLTFSFKANNQPNRFQK